MRERRVRKLKKGISARIVACLMAFTMVVTALNLTINVTSASAKEQESRKIDFKVLESNPLGNDVEICENLIDQNKYTKWCGKTECGNAYVIIKASESICVNEYLVQTADDSYYYDERTPHSWELLACNDYDEQKQTGSWTVIDTVTDGMLPKGNYMSMTYKVDNPEFYQYYKWNITALKNTSMDKPTIQVSEFEFTYSICEGHSLVPTGKTIEPSCTNVGYNVEQCIYCHSKKNVENGQPKKKHDYHNGKCSVCNQTSCSTKVFLSKYDFEDEAYEDEKGFSGTYNVNDGIALKANFGSSPKNGELQTWYIAGKNDDGTLIFVCDPNNLFLESQVFLAEDKCINYKGTFVNSSTYDEEKDTYTNYANQYVASDLRTYLLKYAINNFTSKEKGLMAETNFHCHKGTNSDKGNTYALNDKLYIPASSEREYPKGYITVGNYEKGWPHGRFILNDKKGPYTTKSSFWLREPFGGFWDAVYASPASNLEVQYVNFQNAKVYESRNVLPVFHMDISKLLFVSAAKPHTESAEFSDAMTFRFDGTDEVRSDVLACSNQIFYSQFYEEEEYLYVQGNDNGKDWVYSERIKGSGVLTSEMIKESKSLSDVDLNGCKIWVERELSNALSYAKIIEHTEHDYTGQQFKKDKDGVFYQECRYCGKESEHAAHSFTILNKEEHECMDCHVVASHDFSIYESVDGNIHNVKCSICGYTYQENHAFANTVFQYDSEKGAYYRKCRYCKEKSGYTAHAYTIYDDTKHYCFTCKEPYYEDHDFTNQPYVQVEEGKHAKLCKACDGYITTEPCTGGKATCTKRAVCELCNSPYGEIKHTPSAPVTENIVQPTCEKEGTYDSVIYCSECGKELERESNRKLPLGHDFDTEFTIEQEANCYKVGVKSKHCKRYGCNARTEVTGTERTDHVWNSDYTIDKEATIVLEGSKSIYCSVCGKMKEESTVVIPKKNPCKEHQIKNGKCEVCGYSILSSRVFLSREDFGNTDRREIDYFNSIYNLHGGTELKVNFGSSSKHTNPQTWYIAGKNDDGTLVFVCDPENLFTDAQQFLAPEKVEIRDYSWFYNKDSGNPGNLYEHSDLRKYVLTYAMNNFTKAQQDLMATTDLRYHNIYSFEFPHLAYELKDKLYLPSTSDKVDIRVGNYSEEAVYGKFVIDYSQGAYAAKYSYWLRDPLSKEDTHYGATYASPSSATATELTWGRISSDTRACDFLEVLPVFHMNISTLLFASTANPLEENAGFSTAMTFRFDGKDKIHSNAEACVDKIRCSQCVDGDEYLYVQGNDGTNDWVYSKKITEDEIVSVDDIKAAKSIKDIDLTKCKIWIETKDSNVIYAKEIVATGSHNFVAVEGDSESHKCSVCHKQENHDFMAGEYLTDVAGKHYQKCKDCGAESVHVSCKDTLTPVAKKDATCEEAGNIAYYVCDKCGVYYTDAEAKTPTTLLDVTVAAGHTWNKDYTVDEEPTNTKEGSKSIHCSICGGIKEGSIVTIPKKEAPNPTVAPTSKPTVAPSGKPNPTVAPSGKPEVTPTPTPSVSPTGKPTIAPSGAPSKTLVVAAQKPAKAKIASAKNNKKKTVTVKIKKTKNAKSYKIQYATDKKFKRAKTKTSKSLTVTLKGLKKKKTYYIRVCGVNGKVVGVWSSVKKVKVN